MMNKLLMIVLMLLLSSCATTRYGNYSQITTNFGQTMAQDSVARITMLYPPAKTTFCLNQPIHDAFGLTLLHLLRQKGYRIQERCTKREANFFYVIDSPAKNSLYRITLWINSQALTRAYALQNGTMKPISVWTHQE